MKKFLFFVITSLLVLCGVYIMALLDLLNNYHYENAIEVIAQSQSPTYDVYDEAGNHISMNTYAEIGSYEVYLNQLPHKSFEHLSDAITYAENRENASVMDKETRLWIWDNYPDYYVYVNSVYTEFDTFTDALSYAKSVEQSSSIVYRKDKKIIWSNDYQKKESVKLEAPFIKQMPELPRGCEVTSLAMLLNYKNYDVHKMALAEKIEKNPHVKTMTGGVTYGPDPNRGFVGDMYNISNFGLGVYHQPIYRLLREYAPYSSLDLTGCEFDDLLYLLNEGSPVWVIINSTYKPLNDNQFESWVTESGELIHVTYREHSVLVTGYSGDKIFFNDPLGAASSAERTGFIGAWEQMGRQAVSITPN